MKLISSIIWTTLGGATVTCRGGVGITLLPPHHKQAHICCPEGKNFKKRLSWWFSKWVQLNIFFLVFVTLCVLVLSELSVATLVHPSIDPSIRKRHKNHWNVYYAGHLSTGPHKTFSSFRIAYETALRAPRNLPPGFSFYFLSYKVRKL